MSSTPWKTIILTSLGTVLVLLAVEFVGGWWYLHTPTSIPYAVQSASTTPAFPTERLSGVAGADFADKASKVYSDLEAINQLNADQLNPIFGDIQPRFFQSHYAGIFSLIDAARSYTQKGTALAANLSNDVYALNQSTASVKAAARSQLTTPVAVIQKYTSVLSAYYTALNTVLNAYPFATAKETTDLQNAADALARTATNELIPQLTQLLTSTTTAP